MPCGIPAYNHRVIVSKLKLNSVVFDPQRNPVIQVRILCLHIDQMQILGNIAAIGNALILACVHKCKHNDRSLVPNRLEEGIDYRLRYTCLSKALSPQGDIGSVALGRFIDQIRVLFISGGLPCVGLFPIKLLCRYCAQTQIRAEEHLNDLARQSRMHLQRSRIHG